MFEETEALVSHFKPKVLIIVYQNDREYYLESAAVDPQGRVLEAKPLEQETISEMVSFFYADQQENANTTAIIPENLLRYELLAGNRLGMLWYRKAEQRRLQFAPELNIKSGMAWIPPMIYKTDGKRLEVFALDPTLQRRPEEGDKLYYAPFHNVNDDGDVCLGSGNLEKPRDRSFAGWMKYWEDFFWLTEFSHLTMEKPTKSNLNFLWMRLIKDPKVTWEKLGELKQNKQKLKDILQW